MRPFDTRLLREIPAARAALGRLATAGILAGALAVVQAYAVMHLVLALVEQRPLAGPVAFLLTTLVLRGVVAALRERTAARAADDVTAAVRRRRLTAWLGRPAEARPDPSTASTLATEGVDAIEPYVARYLPALVTAAVIPPLVLIALFTTDWVSGVIVLVTLPLLPLFAALIGQHTEEAVDRQFAGSVRLAGHFADVVRGLPTLVGYQRAEHQAAQVEQIGRQHRRNTMRTLRIAFLSSSALELIGTLSVAIVAVAVGLRLAGGSVGLDVGLLAILLAPEAYWPIRRVGQEFHAAADGAQALTALLEDSTPGDPTSPRPAETAVRSRDLGYAYPGSDTSVLDGLTLDLEPGLTAVTGSSGCGKTTLLELLAGLRTPTSGTITAPRAHLVTQRPFLFPGTLADNGGGLTDVPGDTVLGDDGFGLSAGQRARVALTRAAASDAPLLLVDEPTAHLDPDAAAEITARLAALAGERIVVVVTHDPSVMAAADRIIGLTSSSEVAAADRRSGPDEDLPTPRPTATYPIEASGRHPGEAPDRHWLRPRPGILTAGLIAALATASGVALTATSGWLIVRASEKPVILTLLVAIVLVRTFGVARPALRYLERIASHDAALGDLVQRRVGAYRALIPLTPGRLGRRRRADLLTGFVRDLDDVVEAQVRVVVPVVSVLLTGALSAAIVVWFSAPVAAMVVAQVLLGLLCAAIGLRVERRDESATLAQRASTRRAVDLITTNTSELQAISGEQHALDRLDTASERRLPRSRGRALVSGAAPVVTALATGAAAAALVTPVLDGSLSPALAVLLLLVPFALGDVLDLLPDVVSAWARAEAAQGRVTALLDQQPAVKPTGTGTASCTEGRLSTHQVSAAWDENTPIALPSVTITPGEHLAITGPNGCGKSTFLALLARHLDPVTGSVRLDGQDIRELALDSARGQIALVDDEPHVFAGTVRANLLLARPEAGDGALRVALQQAGLAEWVAGLPEGLDTLLGLGGRSLSGGERTRLAIARALLSARQILLLDEPVAHLDHPTARRVLADLHQGAEERTLALVTHQGLGAEGCSRVLRWPLETPGRAAPDRERERTVA